MRQNRPNHTISNVRGGVQGGRACEGNRWVAFPAIGDSRKEKGMKAEESKAKKRFMACAMMLAAVAMVGAVCWGVFA